MKKNIFEFRKNRHFDAIIEDGFQFFSKNAKDIVTVIWKNNKILFTALSILYILYLYFYLSFITVLADINTDDGQFYYKERLIWFILIFMLFILILLLFLPRFILSVFAYIKNYMDNDGNTVVAQISKEIKKSYGKIFGLFFLQFITYGFVIFIFSIVASIMITIKSSVLAFLLIIGFLIFLIYLSLFFLILLPVYYFENVSIGEAVSRAGKYFKGNFWKVFGLVIVITIISWLLNMIFNLPLIFYLFFKEAWLSDTSVSFTYYFQADIFTSIISIISFIGEWVIRAMMLIITTILYFSLRESVTKERTKEKIEQIGINDEV
jgi:hypothetical protein